MKSRSIHLSVVIPPCFLFLFSAPLRSSTNSMAARSKAWVCGRSPAEIMGSNSPRGIDVCLL